MGVVEGEEASVYMWEWWWGRRLVCTCGSGGGGEVSVYMWEWWWGRRLVCTCGSGGGGGG